MLKKERFIDCYKKWIKDGVLPCDGLCGALPDYLYFRDSFQLIIPTKSERLMHGEDGGNGGLYWGKMDHREPSGEFNSLRQTIVLLCAVMEGEEF